MELCVHIPCSMVKKPSPVFFLCKDSPKFLSPHGMNLVISVMCPAWGVIALGIPRSLCFIVMFLHIISDTVFYLQNTKLGVFGICRTLQSLLNSQTQLKQVKLLQRRVNQRPGKHHLLFTPSFVACCLCCLLAKMYLAASLGTSVTK